MGKAAKAKKPVVILGLPEPVDVSDELKHRVYHQVVVAQFHRFLVYGLKAKDCPPWLFEFIVPRFGFLFRGNYAEFVARYLMTTDGRIAFISHFASSPRESKTEEILIRLATEHETLFELERKRFQESKRR